MSDQDNIKGVCPHCHHELIVPKDVPGLDCPACTKRVIVRNGTFLTIEQAKAHSVNNVAALGEPTEASLEEVDKLIQQGKRIDALVWYRKLTGAGLRDGKAYIDKRALELGVATNEKLASASTSIANGCAMLVINLMNVIMTFAVVGLAIEIGRSNVALASVLVLALIVLPFVLRKKFKVKWPKTAIWALTWLVGIMFMAPAYEITAKQPMQPQQTQGEPLTQTTVSEGVVSITNSMPTPMENCEIRLSYKGATYAYKLPVLKPGEKIDVSRGEFKDYSEFTPVPFPSGAVPESANKFCNPHLPVDGSHSVQEEYKAAVAAGTVFDFDSDSTLSKKDKELLKKGAVNLLRNEPKCRQITQAFPHSKKKGVYVFDCDDGSDTVEGATIFELTASKLASNEALSAPSAYPEEESKQLCHNAIRSNAVHPSTVSMSVFGYASNEASSGNRTINQDFTAENSFGQKLKYHAWCVIEPNGSGEVTIKEQGSPDGETYKF